MVSQNYSNSQRSHIHSETVVSDPAYSTCAVHCLSEQNHMATCELLPESQRDWLSRFTVMSSSSCGYGLGLAGLGYLL